MNVLYRYIASSVKRTQFTGHSAEWDSWCIADILKRMGCQVKAINWRGRLPAIKHTYDAVFDIMDITELVQAFSDKTVKILHLTGSDGCQRNQAERERLEQVNTRRGCKLTDRRKETNPQNIYRSIEIADYVTLLGNEVTLSTYPEKYRDKIHLVDVSASA